MRIARVLQVGTLMGLGIGFCVGEHPAAAGGGCPKGGQCSFEKPAVLFVLDASSGMNAELVAGQTRWEAAVEAIANIVTTQGSYFDQNMRLALMRFGHDPDPSAPGTTIPMDPSGLVDGVALDVHWYDPVGDPTGFFECNGAAILDALNALPPPLCLGAGCTGVEPETDRALQAARALVQSTRADHPEEPGVERRYDVLLVTQGAWVPVNEDPAGTAATMYDEDDVRTWVAVFDQASASAWGDAIAFAGGTSEAMVIGSGAVQSALEDIIDEVASAVVPECTPSYPRVMFVHDASSAMLNEGGVAGSVGETPWDRARAELHGPDGLLDSQAPNVGMSVEDLVHGGVIVYGGEEPAEEQLLVQYHACTRQNGAWALDPNTSCGAGCVDPWGGPPITWTFSGPGDATYPSFAVDTFSHMPRCDLGPVAGACAGSSAFVHRGLELADANLHAYQAAPPPDGPIGPDTPFVNVLVVGESYVGASTHAQVENVLTHLHEADGVTTLVLAVSDTVPAAELADLACWGSGGSGQPCTGGTTGAFDLQSMDELRAAVLAPPEEIVLDPCCAFLDCSENIEVPDTGTTDGSGPDPESSGSDASTASPETGGVDPTRGSGPGASSDDGVVDGTSDIPPEPPSTTMAPTTSTTTPSGSASASASSSASADGTAGTDDATETDPTSGLLARDTCACSERGGDAPGFAWLCLAGIPAVRRRRRLAS